jgi:hypothetical protein
MSAIAGSLNRSPPRGDIRPANAMHRIVRAALAMLDRLVPPRDAYGDTEFPPEWFKYPPI